VSTAGKSVTLSPGDSPAQITITGDLTLDSDDTLDMELQRHQRRHDYDNFVVSGNVGSERANLSSHSVTRPSGDTLILIDGATLTARSTGWRRATWR